MNNCTYIPPTTGQISFTSKFPLGWTAEVLGLNNQYLSWRWISVAHLPFVTTSYLVKKNRCLWFKVVSFPCDVNWRCTRSHYFDGNLDFFGKILTAGCVIPSSLFKSTVFIIGFSWLFSVNGNRSDFYPFSWSKIPFQTLPHIRNCSFSRNSTHVQVYAHFFVNFCRTNSISELKEQTLSI